MPKIITVPPALLALWGVVEVITDNGQAWLKLADGTESERVSVSSMNWESLDLIAKVKAIFNSEGNHHGTDHKG